MPSKKRVIKLYVSDEEMDRILENADRAGLSLSTFGKRVCLGQSVESRVDAKTVLELLKVSADMGRLGGLLKLWLSNPDKLEREARTLLHSIEKTRAQLDAKIAAL
jgi:hypothetical protein